MKTLLILLLSLMTLVAAYNSNADGEIEEWFRRRVAAAKIENRQTERRDYCRDENPMRCAVRQHLCYDFDHRWFSSYNGFISFVMDECPHTCHACYM